MEKETTFDSLNIGDIVKILNGGNKGKIGRVIDMDACFNQVDIKLASGITKYLSFDDIKIVYSNIKNKQVIIGQEFDWDTEHTFW